MRTVLHIFHYGISRRNISSRFLHLAENHNRYFSSTSSSSWNHSIPPWSEGVDESRSKGHERSKEFIKELKRQEKLRESLSQIIRRHLEIAHSKAFSVRSSTEFWKSSLRTSATASKNQTPEETAVLISSALETLVSLNGFERVPLPRENVPLAEGIMVLPNYRQSRIKQRPSPIVWAQCISSETKRKKNAASLPELVQDDIMWYHILENNVEQYLNAKHQRLLETFFFSRQTPVKQDQENIDDDRIDAMKENILFIDENEIVWITDMEQPVRLLALTNHHSYGHKAASTLISVSLVVFGAIPLACRSLQFAYNYPGLSQLVAASVMFTVSYGIWKTRSTSVIRQSQVVSNGIAHRIYARNDAVLWALQEGAVQQVTDGVLTVYNQYADSGNADKMSKLPTTSVDLSSIAQEIGLIQKNPNSRGEKNFVAISWKDAMSLLEKSTANEQ